MIDYHPDRSGDCSVCGAPVATHYAANNRWKGCAPRLALAEPPGQLSAIRRGLIHQATEVQLAAIGLRAAAADGASREELMEEVQEVVQACRQMACYLLQRTLSASEREALDV